MGFSCYIDMHHVETKSEGSICAHVSGRPPSTIGNPETLEREPIDAKYSAHRRHGA